MCQVRWMLFNSVSLSALNSVSGFYPDGSICPPTDILFINFLPVRCGWQSTFCNSYHSQKTSVTVAFNIRLPGISQSPSIPPPHFHNKSLFIWSSLCVFIKIMLIGGQLCYLRLTKCGLKRVSPAFFSKYECLSIQWSVHFDTKWPFMGASSTPTYRVQIDPIMNVIRIVITLLW